MLVWRKGEGDDKDRTFYKMGKRRGKDSISSNTIGKD